MAAPQPDVPLEPSDSSSSSWEFEDALEAAFDTEVRLMADDARSCISQRLCALTPAACQVGLHLVCQARLVAGGKSMYTQ